MYIRVHLNATVHMLRMKTKLFLYLFLFEKPFFIEPRFKFKFFFPFV